MNAAPPVEIGAIAPGYTAAPVIICLLGAFRLLTQEQPVLCTLALQPGNRAPRPLLLETIWPGCDTGLAGQALNNLMHNLRKLLGSAIGGRSPVLVDGSTYRLNVETEIGIDVAQFDREVEQGGRVAQRGDWPQSASNHRFSNPITEQCKAI